MTRDQALRAAAVRWGAVAVLDGGRVVGEASYTDPSSMRRIEIDHVLREQVRQAFEMYERGDT